uniref:Integrase, catalytic region, zinc finger, CCHC-type, peptidase aspartic, catalytic n=1 Tax=Tanacetum cinerariifolium TaxID=118510 RepID=A0A6L2JMN2_TANCI|nr:integrase, catalytic region, zinc finger, CCHC-type, peptidase aspartic, catalytic [Tanacetum cinerariifolium]
MISVAWAHIYNLLLHCGDLPTIWNTLVPIKVNILGQRIRIDRLPNREKLDHKGIDLPSLLCPMCNTYIEDVNHVFVRYGLASQIWDRIFCWLDMVQQGKENGVNILKSIDEGPFQMGTLGKHLLTRMKGRQNRGQGNNERGISAAGNGGAQNRVGNVNPGQARQIKCYNCNDKMLMMQAQENRVVLDEEQLLFLAGGQDNTVDEYVDEPPVQDLALNVDNVFQADECDAFYYDVDEAHTTRTMFMANLSSADPDYDATGPSYDSDILSEYVKDNSEPVVQNNVYSIPNDAYMMIINKMHEHTAKCVSMKAHTKVVDVSLIVELVTCKEQVELKCDEIKRKNLLIVNDNLIADCLSKEVFYIASNSELTVSRFTEMHDAHTVVQARCLKLKAVLSKLNAKIQKDDHNELVKCFSNLEVVQIVLWYLDSCYSKHMMGNRSRLKNFVKRFIETVRFENDHFGAIMGYEDYVIGDSVISRVYYVEGLGYNLFSVGQFCDSDLEVAFKKHSCYVRDTNDVELIKGSRGSNLCAISVEDMMKSSPICLLSKASKNKSWLWHHLLNHLNFGTINYLTRKDLVRGLPRLKFEKDHLCSACQLGKSKKHSHKPKAENTIMEASMFLWAEAVATACYTQNRFLIYTRHNKTPYELVHDKKPDLTFLRDSGALCYPTNNNEDLGKLQPITDIGIFVGYAPSKKGPTPTFLMPEHISLGLVPNLVPAAPYVPPTNKEMEILFQPMFDEYLEPPRVERPISPATAVQIYKVKLDKYGNVLKNKARLVAKGYRQEEADCLDMPDSGLIKLLDSCVLSGLIKSLHSGLIIPPYSGLIIPPHSGLIKSLHVAFKSLHSGLIIPPHCYLVSNNMANENVIAPAPTRSDDQILPFATWISVDILQNTNFFRVFAAFALVPTIYLQQFWNNLMFEAKTGAYRFQLDKDWFRLDANLLRESLEITPVDQAHQFVSPPSGDAIMDFVNQLGYPGEITLCQEWR